MFKITLIGSGQIGSRHLQGLANLKINSSIEVIDPNIESLELAKKRLTEVNKSNNVKSIKFFSSLEESTTFSNLVIVATSSDIRKDVVMKYLENNSTQYMILEKFAFQSIEDYQSILDLLRKKEIKSYVNCPNRAFQSYAKLKDTLKSEKKIQIEVDGGDWNLASNLIHYLDIVNYLSNSRIKSLEGRSLSKRIFNSKRKGFKEFSGEVSGITERGDEFFIRHKKKSNQELTLTFTSQNNQIKVLESQSKAILYKINGILHSKIIDFPILYQSDLTTSLVHDLFYENQCALSSLKDSFHIHKLIINLFNDHLADVQGKVYKKCPIT